MKVRTLGVRVDVTACALALAAITLLIVSFIGVEAASAVPAAASTANPNVPVSCAGPNDVAGCPSSGSLQVQTDIVGRVAPGDQFTTTITGGANGGNTGTTTGTSTGLQTAAGEVAGPIVGVPDTNYTLTEAAATGSGTNVTNYLTTWACRNGSTPFSSGSGNSFTVTFPAPEATVSAAIVCTFTNTPASTTNASTVVPGGQAVTQTPPPTQTQTPGTSETTAPNQPWVPNAPQQWTPTAPTTQTQNQWPAISIHKTADPTTVTAAGQTVTYTFAIANTGNVTLDNVGVTDAQLAPSLGSSLGPITCTTGINGSITLAAGATDSCSATYTVTQADMDNGSITDTGTVRGTPPNSNKPVCATSTATVWTTGSPAISIHKTADPTTVTAAGQTVTYTFAIANTGNVTLDNVGVTDAQLAPSLGSSLGPITCTTGINGSITLAAGATDSCSATYTVTQADMDNGSITDTGTVRGTPPNSNKPVCATSTATVTATQAPGISVIKTASLPSVSTVGQTVTYTFTITNTGNVTLHNVDVSDAQSPPSNHSSLSPIACTTGINGDIVLAPGEADTCSATYTVTQADLTNNSIVDTATATGTPPNSATPVTGTSTVTVLVTKVSVVKSASPAGGVTAGSSTPIVYTLTVSNTGSATTTTPIVVTDSAPMGTTLVSSSPACMSGGPPTCTVNVDGTGTITWTIPAGVVPGASYTLGFSVTTLASDGTGTIANTGSFSGPSCGPPASTTTTCQTNTVLTPVTAVPTTSPVAVTTGAATITPPPPTGTPPIAFTGALLSEEWMVGLGALWTGSVLVVFARWRRRSPRQVVSKR
jgi:uncharacterized repeat protein (TIGR01451 family)